ncbi:MAG: DegT/DnrJ/EryC1/StrS family aminotransferase [Pirellulaceae bacterium]
MWVRLHFDVTGRDLIYALLACVVPGSPARAQRSAEQPRADGVSSVGCLSVRSGLDLLLQALRLPAESEVLLTALTVPDVPRIIRHHALVPVPVDLLPHGCTPALDSLKRAITPATRVLVVAHLFGTRIDMEPILDIARCHGLFVIEDCAQAYHGNEYLGHLESDAVLFSFGPIKTATALGGALMYLRNQELAEQIRSIQAAYPVQRRSSYFCRVVRYAGMKFVSHPLLFGGITRACRMWGIDQDTLVCSAARNFPGRRLFEHLRRQPAVPLWRMMRRRLRTYPLDRLSTRTQRGDALAARLGPARSLHNAGAISNSYWVFPILADNPPLLVEQLRRAGLDATCRTRLAIVEPPTGRPQLEPVNVRRLLETLVFLPWYPTIPERLVERMVRILTSVPQSSMPAEATPTIEARERTSNIGHRTSNSEYRTNIEHRTSNIQLRIPDERPMQKTDTI